MARLQSSTNIGKLIFVVSPLKNNISGKSDSLSLNVGTIIPTILHLKWVHMQYFMVRNLQYSFHTPSLVHQFRKLTWFFEIEIKLFTLSRTLFTWQENAWNNRPINTIPTTLFKLVIWFFFVCNVTGNPPWNSKGIKISLQSSMGHIRFFRILGPLFLDWNFLLLAFTQY